jgi:hypothetical protein
VTHASPSARARIAGSARLGAAARVLAVSVSLGAALAAQPPSARRATVAAPPMLEATAPTATGPLPHVQRPGRAVGPGTRLMY